MAEINNTTSNTLISGTSDADSISNSVSNVTIDGGGGADSIDNYSSSVSIDGGADNDYLKNWDWNNKYVMVRGNNGNDTIRNVGSYSTIDGGAGDDSIYNWSNLVSIAGGAGKDSIFNSNYYETGNNVTLDGNEDDDYIYNWSDSVSINGGEGNDSLYNNDNGGGGSNVTITGGKGDDYIYSSGKNVLLTYVSGDGNDTVIGFNDTDTLQIANDGKGVYSTQTSDNDIVITVEDNRGKITLSGAATLDVVNIEGILSNVIVNMNSNTTVRGTADTLKPDAIYNHGHDVMIQALGGNDTILNYGVAPTVTSNSAGKNVTINAGYGDDSIQNNGRYSVLDGGDGNDTLTNTNWGLGSTFLGGNGNDFISTYNSDSVSIDGGVNNDTIDIRGEAKFVTAKGGTGDDSIAASGSNITINGDDGDDILGLWGSASKVVANGGTGKDYFYNHGSNITINGGADADTVWNSSLASSAIVDLGDGNDSIYNSASNTTILGGADDDTVLNWTNAKDMFISGGYGNDSVKNYGNSLTISGGDGNDSIFNGCYPKNDGGVYYYADSLGYGKDVLFQYSPGDGNDIIYGFKSNSTLQIANGSGTYTPETIGTDVIITVGDGKISLMGAASLNPLNILGIPVNTAINTVSNTTITGSAYDDTITNSGSNVTINALKGNDCISLGSYSKNNTFVYAQGDGYDTISGFKANDTVSIIGSSNYTKDSIDNDVVISLKGGSIILADAANLTSSVKINGGKEKKIGGVKIENNSTEYLLSGTDGRDTLSNYAGGATIQGGNGNDSIFNSTKADFTLNDGLGYVTIDGGAGNDTIFSYDPNVSISGGANADLISLKSSNFSGITINAGTGNDTIYGNANNYGVLYQYKKGDGYDTIYNFSSNDTLSISGANYTTTVVPVVGNVLVNVEGGGVITLVDAADKDIYIYPSSGGKGKFITNSNDNTLLSGSSYADTIKNYGDNVTISAGNANDTIYNNKGDRTSINAGAGHDSIYGNNDYVTVSAGAGKDTITGNHWRSKLSGDGDNDLISITTYWYNTLDGGAGDDTIIAGGSAHSVNGGAGSDLISLSGDALTVAGGADDDTIYGNTATSHLYEYTKGDGNDIIYNYGSNDSITISGSTWTTSTSGKNVIVKVANSGNITLDGAKGKTLNIYPSKVTPSVESGVTAQDVIKKFMGSLDTTSSAGKAALDEAVSVASGGYFTNIGAAIEQMTLDCAAAGNATTFLKDYCGIILDNDDTGAISGSDAGGSKVKTKNSIVPEEGSVHSFTDNSFTAKGLTVQLAQIDNNGNYIRDLNYADLENERQRYIWQALETWWVGGALDLIEESYGDNFGFGDNSSAPVKKIYIGFVSKPFTNTLATTYWWWNGSGDNTKLTMSINMNKYDSIIIDDLDGKRSDSDSSYLDRTLAHEFTHAVMAANIKYFKPAQFIKEGSAELTHGIDDERGDVISYLGGNAAILNNSLNLTDTGTGMTYAYAGGYMFLRYLAKQGAEHYTSGKGNGSVSDNDLNPDTVTVKGKLMTLSKDFPNNAIDLRNYSSSIKTVDATALVKGIEITGNTNANSIVAGSGNDTVFANVGNDTLDGGVGNDALCGEAGNDKLYGNDGDDILNGGTGTDTLTGGDGNDIFVHVADNDFIADYTAGKDKIKLVEGNIVGSSVSGSNVILNLGMHGLITVKGGKGKEITVIDSDGNENAIKFITNDNSSKVTLGSSVIMADATVRTKAIRLTGNALNNSILGGSGKDTLYGADGNDYLVGGKGNNKLYGQNGNDTLWGGAGNDTLKGGDGDDLFIYSAGNDVITDYAAGDKISLGAAISKSSVKGSDATFTIGKNTLTVKDGFRKELVFIDSSGTERTIIGGAYLADDSASSNSTLAAWRAVGDATDRTKAIKLTGNESNNTILGGTGKDSLYGADGNDYIVGNAGADKLYGQNGNDTLWGGIGNDTLKGGAGADVFIYNSGEGKDVISDFDNDDMLQITGKFSASYNSSKKTISFKVDSTSSAIKLKNFTATTFNVNGTNYHISGSKLVKA